MSRFLNSKYESIEPYTPGEQPKDKAFLKLNTNESPFLPSPEVIKAVSREEAGKLNLYPDPDASLLIKAVSDSYGIPESRIMAGNGSDELLAFSFMIFQNKTRKIYFPEVSYGFYKVYADVFGAKAALIPQGQDLAIKIEDYYNLDGMAVIANPNAQTGTAVSRSAIEKILKSNKTNLVLVDEAYVSFGAESCLKLTGEYDNLLVIKTLSKDRNLAGARVGLAFSNEEVIGDLKRIKYSFNPYNINRLSILAGAAAVRDEEYFNKCVKEIIDTREEFVKSMESLGFLVIPSLANFILTKHPGITGEHYYSALREKKILVRHFDSERLRDYVRITIGKREDMRALVAATKEILLNGGIINEKI